MSRKPWRSRLTHGIRRCRAAEWGAGILFKYRMLFDTDRDNSAVTITAEDLAFLSFSLV
jgi:hypothetical protein